MNQLVDSYCFNNRNSRKPNFSKFLEKYQYTVVTMSDNLDEYRGKLQKSKQQLKKVKQLLTQQPHNENLLSVR